MQKNSFIRDSIHGNIEFTQDEEWALEIINTPEFMRLANITQLGECPRVFSSANHTRFSHSIGVFYLAKQYLNALGINNKQERNVVLAAALLHDIGHGPKSHSFELYVGMCHEEMSIKIISNTKGKIYAILQNAGIDINEVISIIKKQHPKKWMIQIVSSQIDADRLDYLLRDSYHSGAVYGKSVDYNFLFKKIALVNGEIVYEKKVVNLIESILFARYQMFKQVYTNIHVLTYETIVIKIFKRWKELSKQNFHFKDSFHLYHLFDAYLLDQKWDIERFMSLNESTYNLVLASLVEEDDSELQTLFSYYFNQKNVSLMPVMSEQEADYVLSEKELYSQKEPIIIWDNNEQIEINKVSDFLIHFQSVPQKIYYKLTTKI